MRDKLELKDKNVALLGYGVESKALLPYLQKEGAIVTVLDKNELLADSLPSIPAILGDEHLKHLTDFDVIFRSPGIPYLTREIQDARRAGVIISSQTQLFFERCLGTIIGVTGTKGKSTTSALIAAILKESQKNNELPGSIYLAGNIGTPTVTLIDQMKKEDWAVVELSSFQLQDLTYSPNIAVVLNVTVDHLDHHRDEAEYIAAKKGIVRYQSPGDFLVINLDSVTSTLFAQETPAQAYFYSRQNSVDLGAFIEQRLGDDLIVLRMADRPEEIICSVEEVKLIGAYNLENICAAITAAALAGASVKSIKSAVTQFTGLSHRMQLVAEKNNIRYFDDSKSTTPDSTIAAVLAFDDPVTLIVGGSSKGADFSELVRQVLASSVKMIICIGEEGDRLQEMFVEQATDQTVVPGGETMQEIVGQATALTEPGGVVLLSPAAASFDMFASAEDRGDQFQKAVLTL